MKELNKNLSKHFTWGEALWLPSWGIYVYPQYDHVWENLYKTAEVMEEIRAIVKKPIIVTSWYRPEKYNEFIKGAKKSMHIQGLAVDFRVKDQICDATRMILLPHLETLDIRMEANVGRNWVHIDLKRDVKLKPEQRFFKP